MSHPDWDSIWQELIMRGEPSPETLAHARECSACHDKVGRARRLDARLRSAGMARAPEPWVERAVRRVTKAAVLTQRTAIFTDEILAELVADSLQPAMGVRGAPSGFRTRVCRGAGFLVSMREEVSAQGLEVRGQVVPPPQSDLPADGIAQLVTERDSELSSLSPHGEFIFGPLQGDVRELVLLLGDVRLRVPHLDS